MEKQENQYNVVDVSVPKGLNLETPDDCKD